MFRDNLLFSPAVALEKITPATPEVLRILDTYGFAMKRTMVNEDEPDHGARRHLLMDAFMPERLIVRAHRAPDGTAVHGPLRGRRPRRPGGRHVLRIPLTIALKFLGVPDDGAEQLRRFAVAHTLNTWGRPRRPSRSRSRTTWAASGRRRRRSSTP